MKAIKKIETFLFESAAWKLVLAIALLTIFKTGVWYIPGIGALQTIAQNPFINPFIDQNAHFFSGVGSGLI